MLALSSAPVQTELAARDVLVGCVAGNDPRCLGQALRLVQSIRWFGGELASAQVVVCIPGWPDPGSRQAFETCGAEVRIGGDRQVLAEMCGDGRELLLLDCDSVVVQDPLPWMRRGLAERPVELDFRLDPGELPPPEGCFAVDPAILRYQDRVDSEGYIFYSHYPFAQVRIEAFNRRLRQEREHRSGPARPMRESPAPAAGPAAQVVVLGMHRSGTSALTALLRLSGLWAGEEGDFLPADRHNETGYWEHWGVWSVDEAILQALGASWSEVADLDLSRLDEGFRARFTERARATVRDLERHGSWVVKDPRLCLLFPFWREILERPFCVLIHRDPLPVARSLAVRDGLPIPYGIALWENYTLEALASTRGLPRVLISHRELLADPEATLRRLLRELARHRPELAGLRVPGPGEIRAVLDPALVHHAQEPELERSHLTPPQLALLEAMTDGSALDLDPVPPLSPGARDLLAAHQGALAATQGLRDRLALQTRTAARLQQDQERSIAAHREELAAYQSALAAVRNVLADQERTLAAQEDALAEKAADLRRALSWIDDLDAIVSAILESRSWKIGRAVTAGMGRLAGRPRISARERRDLLMAQVRSWRGGAQA